MHCIFINIMLILSENLIQFVLIVETIENVQYTLALNQNNCNLQSFSQCAASRQQNTQFSLNSK